MKENEGGQRLLLPTASRVALASHRVSYTLSEDARGSTACLDPSFQLDPALRILVVQRPVFGEALSPRGDFRGGL